MSSEQLFEEQGRIPIRNCRDAMQKLLFGVHFPGPMLGPDPVQADVCRNPIKKAGRVIGSQPGAMLNQLNENILHRILRFPFIAQQSQASPEDHRPVALIEVSNVHKRFCAVTMRTLKLSVPRSPHLYRLLRPLKHRETRDLLPRKRENFMTSLEAVD